MGALKEFFCYVLVQVVVFLGGWEIFYLLAPSQIVITKGSKWAGCYEIVWRQIGML